MSKYCTLFLFSQYFLYQKNVRPVYNYFNLNFVMSKTKMSRVMRKPAFCIYENKDADQLRGNREANQHLCFRYTDSTIPLLPKSEISSIQPSSVVVQPGLSRTWSDTPKTGFLTTRLKCQQLIWIAPRYFLYTYIEFSVKKPDDNKILSTTKY